MSTSVYEKIATFNAGRDPERLALKLKKMRIDPFVFLRGTCHLFYEELQAFDPLKDVPNAWVCGDLHLENFGSYKGDNRLAYFDINDFDEAALAPCTWDIVRFLVSLQLGLGSSRFAEAEIATLCEGFITAYSDALVAGKARWVERETSTGVIRDLLDSVGQRSRPDFLDSRTELKGKARRLRCDGKKALPARDGDRDKVEAFLAGYVSDDKPKGFFDVIDIARRIAGTGSLGLERYIVLVRGKGSPDANYLLDIKEAAPSSLAPFLHCKQPAWRTQAQRVVQLQDRMQASTMAFLRDVEIGTTPFILRGLQPSEDRVAPATWQGKLSRVDEVVRAMGQITAWAHLRSSGRGGSALADELIAFGTRSDWRNPLLATAAQLRQTVKADWKAYCRDCDDKHPNGEPLHP
jgi:uncharacterized protein (DUF2252 family)